MNNGPSIGIMLYCREGDEKNVFADPKYKELAEAFVASGMAVETVNYNDDRAERLRTELSGLAAVLVWVNPIEQGRDRKVLDALLSELSQAGVFVSSLPETIQKIGTKRVLYETRNLEFGSDVEMYANFKDFEACLPAKLATGQTRVLKQFRGNGGNGVFKVVGLDTGELSVLHAKRGSVEERMSAEEFLAYFQPYFDGHAPMLDQAWNDNLSNGMVRCYMTGNQVAGFGYQETNTLFPAADGPITPGKRFYFTENCALFSDLKAKMETTWIDDLTTATALGPDKLPVIWDADFFINSMQPNSPGRYTLCEINVSSVSPFPESAIPHIVEEVTRIIK